MCVRARERARVCMPHVAGIRLLALYSPSLVAWRVAAEDHLRLRVIERGDESIHVSRQEKKAASSGTTAVRVPHQNSGVR